MAEDLTTKEEENTTIHRELTRAKEENATMINNLKKTEREMVKLKVELKEAKKKWRETDEMLKEQTAQSVADSVINPVLLEKMHAENEAKVQEVEEKLTEETRRVVAMEKS